MIFQLHGRGTYPLPTPPCNSHSHPTTPEARGQGSGVGTTLRASQILASFPHMAGETSCTPPPPRTPTEFRSFS
ncbi:MAG: hypothetical protein ACO34E_05160, partial [Limisphaerales bacterium]